MSSNALHSTKSLGRSAGVGLCFESDSYARSQVPFDATTMLVSAKEWIASEMVDLIQRLFARRARMPRRLKLEVITVTPHSCRSRLSESDTDGAMTVTPLDFASSFMSSTFEIFPPDAPLSPPPASE